MKTNSEVCSEGRIEIPVSPPFRLLVPYWMYEKPTKTYIYIFLATFGIFFRISVGFRNICLESEAGIRMPEQALYFKYFRTRKCFKENLAKTLNLSFFITSHHKNLKPSRAHSETTDLILKSSKNIHLVTKSL
jgi:hypothetical protein